MLLENLKPQKHFKFLQQSIKATSNKIFEILERFLTIPRNIITAWHKLHGNQKIYVLVLGLIFYFSEQVFSGSESHVAFIGCIALIAMARELWSLFTRIWDTMFGKSIILVLYAVVANFTLALAAQKINIIVGVAPSELVYTQGLTTLMMLPFWILLLSVFALTVVFVGAQLKSVFFGILRFLRLHHAKPENKEHFSGLFLVIRILILPLVVMTLAQGLTWYSQKIHIQSLSFDITDLLSKEQKITLKSGTDNVKKELKAEMESDLNSPSANEGVPNDQSINKEAVFRVGLKLPESEPESKVSQLTLFDRAIASFVYHFEAFEFSRCKTTNKERAVPINENDILVVEKDDSDIGFKFSARLCELK
ncbi:hypothetical protein [Pseudoalteromonas denitrificans]|uniref:Uncharacterized protein n=1 Tax=Pseudoalteromonas denitrificans DSM 6059 TaxID=1123010 RepID=A0A1I1MU55_9GAMM|nr:hypothetical protein [Pseudoalteromonas denitrificans]SFC88676.1 hypothetical protein SAMN02745724_02822 [Pseudoalteromonas denitrificans DSM 6059]